MKNPTISADSLAQLTGFTSRWLRDLAAAGHIPKAKRGNYPRDETLTRLFAYLRERTAPNAMQSAKLEREQARARIAQVNANLAEKKTVPLEATRRQWASAITTMKFRLYGCANQVASEVAFKCGLTNRQLATLRTVVARHHSLAIRDAYVGSLCAVICPECQKSIQPPEGYQQMQDLPLMYQSKERFKDCIEQLAKNSKNITTAIEQRKQIMTLKHDGTWNEPQFIENKNEK